MCSAVVAWDSDRDGRSGSAGKRNPREEDRDPPARRGQVLRSKTPWGVGFRVSVPRNRPVNSRKPTAVKCRTIGVRVGADNG